MFSKCFFSLCGILSCVSAAPIFARRFRRAVISFAFSRDAEPVRRLRDSASIGMHIDGSTAPQKLLLPCDLPCERKVPAHSHAELLHAELQDWEPWQSKLVQALACTLTAAQLHKCFFFPIVCCAGFCVVRMQPQTLQGAPDGLSYLFARCSCTLFQYRTGEIESCP